MAQLSIPQSLIGALIDIADLGTLDYFAPSERCAHWALYNDQRHELLCPCSPAEVPGVEKLFESAAKILYENFPRYIDTPEQIIPYTSRQELIAALLRGNHAEEGPEDTGAEAPTAETVTEAGETAVHNDEETSVPAEAAAPVTEQPKPVPSPTLIARRARAGAEQGTSGEQVPEEKTVTPSEAPKPSAPKPSVAQFTAPKPTPPKPSAPTPVASAPLETPSETRPAAPKPSAPAVPAAPSPVMFRKATLTYRPPQIEEYLQGLRARQQAAEQEAEQEATPGNIAPDVPNTPAPMPVPSAGTAPATSEVAASEAPSRPA